MTDKDDFGNRIKTYESIETDRILMPHLPIYVRLDGKSFHNFTRDMKRPYDENLSRVMIETTIHLVKETHALIGYTQSDEISLIYYYSEPGSEPLYGGRISKINSILASMCSVKFNQLAAQYWPEKINEKSPIFDCRVFNLPNTTEATNTVLWREIDATKNAISMAARAYFSHNELQNKSGKEMQEMLFQKHNINFNDYPAFFKRGTFVRREPFNMTYTKEEWDTLNEKTQNAINHRIREAYDDPWTITRHIVKEIDMPSFRKVTNRVGVIFNNENPVVDMD